ncbi:hypothetical protein GQR60_04595 [Labilibaculum sp. A4]|uniref:hypothetical protein n=1 Tax=Labilibaculum euxinus TaxID=2686357 RepID=UPI000F61FC1A|nr:hypothetical protein [Labilibaculum euxinus]MDQ1772111.1 hypothetical protein [Labilibaculum euxinus]MWN75607.1 hypothetical protein [Labilibaculum euxinus]
MVTYYIPTVAGYNPKVAVSIPMVADYTPTVAGYNPTVATSIPTVVDYIPMVETYRSAATMVNHQQNYVKMFLLDSSHTLE